MTDIERIEHRLAAVERAVIDGDYEVDELSDLATLTETVERLEARVDEQERRLATLEAETESLAGFVDNVESVNDDVERQAATAVATVDRLEDRIDELESALEAVRQETADLEAETTRAKRLDAGDPDPDPDPNRDGDRRDATEASTEVAFSEGESTADGDGLSTPEQTVSEIVGDGSGTDRATAENANGNANGNFEWCAEGSNADAGHGDGSASEPGAAGLNDAEQSSVDRMLSDSDSKRSGSDAGGEADGREDAGESESAGSTESDGFLSAVRSKLS